MVSLKEFKDMVAKTAKKVAKKTVDTVAEDTQPVEVVVAEETSTPVRDEAFFKKHTNAREDVIYG